MSILETQIGNKLRSKDFRITIISTITKSAFVNSVKSNLKSAPCLFSVLEVDSYLQSTKIP